MTKRDNRQQSGRIDARKHHFGIIAIKSAKIDCYGKIRPRPESLFFVMRKIDSLP